VQPASEWHRAAGTCDCACLRSWLSAFAEAVGLQPRSQGHKAILTMAALRIRSAQLDYNPAIINSYQAMWAIITLKNIVTNQLCSLPLSLMVQL
jgi:hypothetical protein